MEAVSPTILLELTIKPFLFLTPLVLLNRKEGAACKGEGRSTCQKGEFCRDSVCTKVNLKVNYSKHKLGYYITVLVKYFCSDNEIFVIALSQNIC
jgi:hypothetical protein